MTEARRVKIKDWEVEDRESGASLQDVSGLGRILKRAIIIRDIAGVDLLNSGKKYRVNRLTPIEVVLHNGHAWGANLHFPQVEKSTFTKVMCGRPSKKPLGISRKRFGFSVGTRYLLLTNSDSRMVVLTEHARPMKVLSERARCWHRRILRPWPSAPSVRTTLRASWPKNGTAGSRPGPLEGDIQKACVENGHGGLWSLMDYDTRDVVSIDMKSCFPASFQGEGEAKPYFERFGHPSHRMTRVAINGPLPQDIGTGFAQVRTWKFASDCHPVIPAWFGKHFDEKGWAPTQLLTYLVEARLLTSLEVTEVILSFKQQKEVWLPDSRDQACGVIGKFTQGCKADGRRLTRRLVTDEGELDYLVRDTRQNGTLVGSPMKCPLGHILTYYDGSQPQYTHLRASMLAYAHINLLEMLRRFKPGEVVRVATDSIYAKKSSMAALEGVQAYVAPKTCSCGEKYCDSCLTGKAYSPPAAPAQWRDKGETIYAPADHAAYTPKPE